MRRGGSTRAWRRVRAYVLVRDGGRCGICGGPGATSVDHIIPVARGGSDHPSNLRAAHLRCNSARGARAPERPAPSRSW